MGRILRWGSLQICQSLVNGLQYIHRMQHAESFLIQQAIEFLSILVAFKSLCKLIESFPIIPGEPMLKFIKVILV